MLNDNDKKIIFGEQNEEAISVHMLNSNVLNLGPGKRYGIWVQGCLKRCEGCMVPESHSKESHLNVCYQEIAEILSNSNFDGVTISGGEPLLQWRALGNMLSVLRKNSSKLNILLYTGYSFEDDLFMYVNPSSESYHPEFANFFNMLDWWIDGEYLIEFDDQKGLRGSSNQLLYGNIQKHDAVKSLICKQIAGKKWESMCSAKNEKPNIVHLENDPLNSFVVEERKPVWDTQNGMIIGIPSRNHLGVFGSPVQGVE